MGTRRMIASRTSSEQDLATAVAGARRPLVERAMAGDHDAFAELVRTSTDRLYGLAALILRDGDRSQDAVQEALVAAWRDVRGLRDPDAWDAWLYRLVVRSCYRVADSDRRRRVVEAKILPPSAPSIGLADASADRDSLSRAIAALPLEQRAVLVAHFYLGLPIAQAAAVLSIPVGTCKSRLARGLGSLRAVLAVTEKSA